MQLLNLSSQLINFLLISVLLTHTAHRKLAICSWLWKSVRSSNFFWIFSFWQMLWKIIKKLIIICISFIFNLSSSSSKLYISRIVAFTEISMIRFQSWEHNKKPLNIWLVIASHVQLERSLNCFLDFIITLNDSLLKIWNSL